MKLSETQWRALAATADPDSDDGRSYWYDARNYWTAKARLTLGSLYLKGLVEYDYGKGGYVVTDEGIAALKAGGAREEK